MRFTQSVFALAALTSTVFAQTAGFDAITNPSAADQQLAPGSSFEITWQATTFTSDTDTVSIILMAGETPNTLQPGTTPIASSIKNSVGKYTWTVPSSTATTYGFKIVLDASPATFQYSFPFHITGGSSSSSSASGSSSASSTASVTASSSNTTTAVSSSITTPSGNTTSVKTDILTSTVCTVCLGSNSTVAPVVTPSSNVTLATTIGATKTTAAASSSSTAKPSGNAAVSNVAQGGLAMIGGLVLAIVL